MVLAWLRVEVDGQRYQGLIAALDRLLFITHVEEGGMAVRAAGARALARLSFDILEQRCYTGPRRPRFEEGLCLCPVLHNHWRGLDRSSSNGLFTTQSSS